MIEIINCSRQAICVIPAAIGECKRILFLDRDGVINIDTGYPGPQHLQYNENIIRLIKEYQENYLIDSCFIVTNQSGVARGLLTYREAICATHLCHQYLLKNNIPVVGYCIDFTHPEKSVFRRLSGFSNFRKPNSGMITLAGNKISTKYDPKECFLIGDKPTDIQAALSAGIPVDHTLLLA